MRDNPLDRFHGVHRPDHHGARAAGTGKTVYGPFGQVTEAHRDAGIGLGLERLGGMVAHFDHLGGGNDIEPVGRTAFAREHGPDPRLVAEQYDTAVGPDRIECHDSPFDRSLGRIITSHGIYTNL